MVNIYTDTYNTNWEVHKQPWWIFMKFYWEKYFFQEIFKGAIFKYFSANCASQIDFFSTYVLELRLKLATREMK